MSPTKKISRRDAKGYDIVRQGKPERRDVHRIPCGGGYRIVRKISPGS